MGILRKIACVEDDEDIRAIATLALADLSGFDVATYRSGPDALKNIEAFAPDLIVLDVMMPEMDGVTLYKQLRKIPQFHQTPIIFMTAKAQMTELEKYLSLGAAGVITKPFDPLNLCNQISEFWEQARSSSLQQSQKIAQSG